MAASDFSAAANRVLQTLPVYLKALNDAERTHAVAGRVDGLIIGTGEADFTKGNTHYRLSLGDKTFELLDVPGIEGDESRYVDEVKKAIAAAHLVVYVNGTNKKPEKSTAEKIRGYLKRGTQVLPLVNIRGNADAYEFEEDRISLLEHGGAASALEQTTAVLEATLGKELLLPGECVQGLLAFCSLALDEDGKTTIHPSRNRNLMVQQRNYLKNFSSAASMARFSRIDSVARVLHSKLDSWQLDIVESNKRKISELLNEYLTILDGELASQREFMRKTGPEFDKCRIALGNAVSAFRRSVENQWLNHWDNFFDALSDQADDIVDDSFDDKDAIPRQINNAFHQLKTRYEQTLQDKTSATLSELQSQLKQALDRLKSDIDNVQFQQQLKSHDSSDWQMNTRFQFDGKLDMGDMGKIALKIGGYIATGAMLGTPFGPIGNIIGGAIGGIVGAVFSLVGFLQSRSSKVRKAQSQVRSKINSMRYDVRNTVTQEAGKLATTLETQISQDLLPKIDALYDALNAPEPILQQQHDLITQIKNQLEHMPYGRLNPIQH